jgi:predicted dehydrogenase/nucleoside-diphosphate-sugar epimerase
MVCPALATDFRLIRPEGATLSDTMLSEEIRNTSRFRVAVVGCGAVTKASLLPVLAGHDRIEVVALVDRDIARARDLAQAYKVPRYHSDALALGKDEIDGVVLATPPAHHAAATLAMVEQGIHVFVEKPMAIGTADAEAMVDAADKAGVVLAVGLYRRLLPVSRLLRGMLDSEMLGRPLWVDIEEGGEYSWELATLSVLSRAGGGGGVLIDLGTHLLDQLFFVLPGEASVTRFADNARGGVETDCELELALQTRWGVVPARVELSRTRQLRGTIQVACQHGMLELTRGDFGTLLVHGRPDSVTDPVTGQLRPISIAARWGDEGESVGYKAFRAEFDDWIDAIGTGRDPQLSGRSVLPVVRTVDACYASAGRLVEPWVDQGLAATQEVRRAPALATGAKPRVLVTGAGGFLGCRTVECLLLGGAWEVRALVRRPASAARLARFPVDIVLGDVTSATDMTAVVKDCDAVVHCAVGTGWPPAAAFTVTVDGTKQTAEAALAAGVRRFVHISSMAVHGNRVPPQLVETSPLDPGSGADYGRAKYLAEQAVRDAAARGLRAISLRPARIYGPFSRTFTVRPLQALREGRLVLSGDAESPSNMVFVDNVVEAILRALNAPDTECGEAFLINDPDQLSWRAFYEYFAIGRNAGVRVTAPSSQNAAETAGLASRWMGGLREIAFSPEVRSLAKKILWTDPVGSLPRRWWERSPGLQQRVQRTLGIDAAVTYREPPTPEPEIVEFQIDPTLVVFDKAAARLGYVGLVSREEALRLTRDWATAARLL